MILTCPACGTSYVVKDGAIPPPGRQVRCASCKHSWHQEAEAGVPSASDDEVSVLPAEAHDEAGVPPRVEPLPVMIDPTDDIDHGLAPGLDEESAAAEASAAAAEPIQSIEAEAPPAMSEPTEPVIAPEPVTAVEESFDWEHARNVAPSPRRGRGWIVILALIAVVGALAAAAWFLAPHEWLARAGVATDTVNSPLKLMVTSQDRQKLASGNDLVSLSGRVINPTDATQSIPPLQADLRNGAGKLVYSWTIAPPATSLPPRASASFNAAELGVPADATSLTLRWAN